MGNNVMSTVIMVAIAALAVFIFFKIIKAQIKGIFRFLLNAVIGLLMLMAVNYFGASFGILIPITWITLILAGLCGPLGVAALLAYKIIILQI